MKKILTVFAHTVNIALTLLAVGGLVYLAMTCIQARKDAECIYAIKRMYLKPIRNPGSLGRLPECLYLKKENQDAWVR